MADGHIERPKNMLYKSALAYAKFGYKVFPLVPRGKMPLDACNECAAQLPREEEDGKKICSSCGTVHEGKRGVGFASSDVGKVDMWWSVYRDANIGVATGDGLLVLDIDGPKGAATLQMLEDEHGNLPPTPCQITGKGRHYLFSVEGEVRNSTGKVGYRGEVDENGKKVSSGIDTRGDGGYIVICPSIHPNGQKYSWDGDLRPSKIPLAKAPEWLLEEIAKPNNTYSKRPKISEQASVSMPQNFSSKSNEKYIDAAVQGEYQAVATAGNGTRNHTLNQAAFNLGTLVGANQITESFVMSHLLKAAEASGLANEDGVAACQKTIESGLKAGIQQPRQIPEPQMRTTQQVKPAAAVREPSIALATRDGEPVKEYSIYKESVWIDGKKPEDFILNAEGAIAKSSLHNALLHLRHEKALKGLFSLNEMSRQVMVTRNAPWGLDKAPRLLCDADIIALSIHMEHRNLNLKSDSARKIIGMVAAENKTNPIKDKLESFEWDGNVRLDSWTSDYLGTEETLFNSEAGAKWLISAVARIMKPGCKVDTMLVLEGAQGLRKSSALAAIAEALDDHCFTDRLSKLDSKDAVIELQGNVIVEIAELDAFKGAQVSTIKAFLSRQIDKVRLPWDSTITEIKRACVFAGTVNPGGAGWLSDATGARRFWPMTVTTVDLLGIQEIATQLWAEALIRYRNGEEWWITNPEVLAQAERAVDERYEEDVWAPLINDFLYRKTEVHIQHILKMLDITKDRWDKTARNRIGSHLRQLGFDNKSKRTPNGWEKIWVRSEPYGVEIDD